MSFLAIVAFAVLHAVSATIPGHIYCFALNGSTNEPQLLSADLDTFIVEPLGPSLGAGVTVTGPAFVHNGSTFFSELWRHPGNSRILTGFSLTTGLPTVFHNTTAWPGSGGTPVRVAAMFERGDGTVMTVGDVKGEQVIHYLVAPLVSDSPAVLIGAVNVSGDDIAFDSDSDILYEIVGAGVNDDSGGTMFAVAIAPEGGPPTVVGEFLLANDFAFPLYDAGTHTLAGLTLAGSAQQGYARNLTVITPSSPSTYNASDHGTIGEGLFVVLQDGPKAIDAVTRRAFFMLASGPFAEFELATIDLDSSPPRIDEAPGLCGFIGYCPFAIAYGP